MREERNLNILIIIGLFLFVFSVAFLFSDIDFIYESEVLYDKLNSEINPDSGEVTETQKPKPTAIPKPVEIGDVIQGMIIALYDEYIEIEIEDSKVKLKLFTDENTILYAYNGSNIRYPLDNGNSLQKGIRVEVKVGDKEEKQDYDVYYAAQIGILHTYNR